MASSRQLYDTAAAVYYLIDASAMIFKISADHLHQETRTKPYFAAILETLFHDHPVPVSYQKLMAILKANHLACPDETRLHRKMSELRKFLSSLCPGLDEMICNHRGVGYGLPLSFKDPAVDTLPMAEKIRNPKLRRILAELQNHITISLALSQKCRIIKSEDGFVLKRQMVAAEIEELLTDFEKQKKQLFIECKYHTQDFGAIRLEFLLAKLKTYLGLARISEFSISKEQWCDWHEHEAQHIWDDLIQLLQKHG